jgi:hypothetical protein
MSTQKRKKTTQELSGEGSVSETFQKALKSGSTWEDKVNNFKTILLQYNVVYCWYFLNKIACSIVDLKTYH